MQRIRPIIKLSENGFHKLMASSEGHFLDLKSREIKPAKLAARTLSGFANAEGGNYSLE